MRTIKFRAKSPTGWHESTGVVLIDETTAYIPAIKDISADGYNMKMIKVDPKTICQFTGLHDKNGKEIYQDDVIRILYSDWASKDENDPRTLEQYLIDKSTVGYVAWDEHNTGWVVMVKSKYSVNDDGTVMSSIIHGTHGFREVIGNRFENPELLAP